MKPWLVASAVHRLILTCKLQHTTHFSVSHTFIWRSATKSILATTYRFSIFGLEKVQRESLSLVDNVSMTE